MHSPSASPASISEDEASCERAVRNAPNDAEAWYRLGLARQSLSKHAEAAQALNRAISLERGRARYHHALGNALVEDGKLDRAITAYRRALRLDESVAEAHNDLGTAYFDKQWYAEAEACFRKAIELRPEHGIAHANLGAALRAQGRLGEGRRAYQRALLVKLRGLLPRFLRWRLAGTSAPAAAASSDADAQVALRELSAALAASDLPRAQKLAARAVERFPGQPDVLYLAASVREESMDPAGALALAEGAITLKADRAEYHVLRSRLLAGLGRIDEALQAALKALQLEPGSADAHATLSAVYRGANRLELAEQAARRAVELDDRCHAGHSGLSSALWLQGRLEEAERHGRKALEGAPRSAHYRVNLAVILKDAAKIDEARALYHAAIEGMPKHPGLLLNMGTLALECDMDIAGAHRWYEACLALGDDPKAMLSDAIIDLLEARYDRAWPKYEARKRVSGHVDRHAPFAAYPTWNGDAGSTGRLLVYGEQGLGDEIMFSSMLGDLQARVPAFSVMCDARLRALLARSFPALDVIGVPTGTKPIIDVVPDQVLACGSLAGHFRRSPADFPDRRAYLVPDPAKTSRYRERIAALGTRRKIGFSWVGGLINTNQIRRSLGLEQLRPLFEMPDTAWISLQYGSRAAELKPFAERTGLPLHELPGSTDDMDELAGLVHALDIVVSVCNATVHIAGAIGKDVLVMAPHLPEWRYGLRGERMAWYPAARVFRQDAPGDWASVIDAVRARLRS